MKKKKLHPIYLFSILFVGLVAIQSYFLYNSVLLKRNEIKIKAKDILEDAASKYLFFKTSDGEKNIYKIDRLRNQTDLEANLRADFKFYNDSIQGDLAKFIAHQYAATGLLLAYKREIVSIYDGIRKMETLGKPIILFETKRPPINNYSLYESNWETSYSSSEKNLIKDDSGLKNLILNHKSDSFVVNLASYYDVLNMNQILFKELWSLFLVSLLLMLMMLYIYYQSYKKYKEQVLQVQLLHDTIDNISHEFKTPLATMLIAVKQLRIVNSDDTLDLIDRQIVRLENVLKPLNAQDQDLDIVTQQQVLDLLNDYQVLYPKIYWTVDVSDAHRYCLTTFEMQTILNNLIENSLKYGARSVDIFIANSNGKLKIVVTDDGMGIAKEQQDKIFERFYRVSTQNVHNVKGLGLGLFLVQNIVQKHGGSINIKSQLDHGCKLTIEL